MKTHKQSAVVLSSLAVVVGCAYSTPPSAVETKAIDPPPATTSRVAPRANERTVVTLTEAAIAQFKAVLATEPGKHLRLSVKREGPTGFMYDLQIDESIGASDFVDRSHGFTLVVDPTSSIFLEGATIDWETLPDGRAGFKFDNPNAVQP